MVEPGTIAATLTSLKNAGDLIGGIARLALSREAQKKINELHQSILAAHQNALDAQAAQAESSLRVAELEKQLDESERWAAVEGRYELHDFGGQTYAYLVKEDARGAEPLHRLCAHCFQVRQKSILQAGGQNASGQDVYNCPRCDKRFDFGFKGQPQQIRAITDYDVFD